MNVFKTDELILSLKKLAKSSVDLRCQYINCHVLDTFKKLLKTLLEPQTDLPESFLFEIDTILDYLHQELNTGRLASGKKKEVPLNRFFRALEYCANRGPTKLYHSLLC